MWRMGQSEDWDSGRGAGRSPAESSWTPHSPGSRHAQVPTDDPETSVTRAATNLARELTDKCC
jgi:hypothetical protein